MVPSPTQDRAKALALNKQLRKQLSEFRAPQVMMYIREKIRNGDLEKSIRMWERKVEIAEVSLKTPQCLMHCPHPPSFV